MVPKRKNVIMIIMLVMCFFGRDGWSPPDVGKPSHPGQLDDNKRPLDVMACPHPGGNPRKEK